MESALRKLSCAALLTGWLLSSISVLYAGGNRPTDLPSVNLPIEAIPLDSGLTEPAEIVVRDFEIPIDDPVVPGERLVLTTVGTAHPHHGSDEFHPFVSVLIDKTFEESPNGEWLAIWNLGRQRPNVGDYIESTIPGILPIRKSSPGELRKLQEKIDHFDELSEKGKVGFPKPFLKANDNYRRSTTSLILNISKKTFTLFDIGSYVGNLFFRSFILRRNDLLQREFQQAYMGLAWYADRASVSEKELELSAANLQELKFRLLADRHVLGRWVLREAGEDFVHGFESEVRDHLWGTSCYLASAANEYRLGYEEIQRVTATGVPLTLGGILYYDPELAPEKDQVKWSLFNPFDLVYNPFTKPEIQQAAADGSRVPLAIYSYQSNLALKPIVAIDFWDKDNPRIREAATYWRQLGREAIGATKLGLLAGIGIRAGSFLANRKGLTWLTDKKLALGIEEFRLSMMNHLYFDAGAADQMADLADYALVNPLVQPSRHQAKRAELHYRSLQANVDDLKKLARDVRIQLVRRAAKSEYPNGDGVLSYANYTRHLARQQELSRVRMSLDDEFVLSLPTQHLLDALDRLGELGEDSGETVDTLMRLGQRARDDMRDRSQSPLSEDAQLIAARVQGTLERIYEHSGGGDEQLQRDLDAWEAREQEKREKEIQDWRKAHAGKFARTLRQQRGVLEGFVASNGDLLTYSPWYVNEALEFFQQLPLAVALNPLVAEQLKPKDEQAIETLLGRVEDLLTSAQQAEAKDWLGEQKAYCLRSARLARVTFQAFLAGPEDESFYRVSGAGGTP